MTSDAFVSSSAVPQKMKVRKCIEEMLNNAHLRDAMVRWSATVCLFFLL